MSVRIITDSAADISQECAKEWNITVIPLKIRFEEEDGAEYLDGVTITNEQFYQKLILEQKQPKTSQISPYDYEKVFQEVKEAGDTAVYISLSSKISGSYQSANIAADDYEGIVYIVDSLEFCIGQRILVELAVRLRDEGKSAEEIAQTVKEEQKNVRLIALFDTLEYLKRGGRLSKGKAFVGSVLSLKPVLTITDGEVEILGKARGAKVGNNMLKEYVRKEGGIHFDKPYCLGYSGLSDERMWQYVENSRELYDGDVKALPVAHVGAVIGTYAGPDAIAVAFFCQE
ncbi:MAG: DegV family protein [Lachnospiraceae bacterium]|nr:DegV family protein [Lachnospiraceae bacterium]